MAARQEQNHRSRAADFYDSATPADSNSRTGSSNDDDCERMLVMNEKGGAGGGSGARLWLTGWRGGVTLNTLISLLILLTGIVCLVLAVSRFKMLGGESAIYTGSCASAERTTWGLHVLINIFAIILLAIGNYVFQILCSPTRVETSAAHDRQQWVDIGVPSLRNLRYISNSRVLLAAVVLVAAVSTQIM
jgi:uncharacterized membrane protein